MSGHLYTLPLVNAPGDAELIQRILRGDPEPYALLVRRYQEVLYRYAYGMVGDSDTAADLVQDALVKAYGNLATCQDPERFGGWVFQILRNRCRDYLKAPRRRTVSIEDEGPLASADPDPLLSLEQSETGRQIAQALARLPEAHREAFLLKHVEELSYEEMSERLGVGVSALKMRVMRAREALQIALAENTNERAA